MRSTSGSPYFVIARCVDTGQLTSKAVRCTEMAVPKARTYSASLAIDLSVTAGSGYDNCTESEGQKVEEFRVQSESSNFGEAREFPFRDELAEDSNDNREREVEMSQFLREALYINGVPIYILTLY